MSSKSKASNAQVQKLTCKVRALGGDMYDVERSSVSRMYEVNRYNMVIDHRRFEDRRKSLTPFLEKMVADYQKDGYQVVKRFSDKGHHLYHLEAQFDGKWIYISLEYFEPKDYSSEIRWNVSVSDQQEPYWSK